MDTDAILTEAERVLRTGDVRAAEAVLAKQWPDPTKAPGDALHLLATMRQQTGNAKEAELFFRAAIKVEPNALRHFIALGHLLAGVDNVAGAMDSYASAMRINAEWPGLRFVFAHAAYRAGRIDEAERAARQVVNEAPNAAAWDLLSCVLRAQNKGDEALSAADSALRFEPGYPPGRNSRGLALMMVGRGTEAVEVFDLLVESGVISPVVWLNRAAAYENVGRGADAAAILADAAARWPHYPNLQAQLAARRR